MSVSTAPDPLVAPSVERTRERQADFSPRSLVWAVVPLLLLAAVLAWIVRTDAGLGDRTVPPIETLSVQRVILPAPGQIELDVVNGGPDPISIAQVLVDEAYWQFSMEPAGNPPPPPTGGGSLPFSLGRGGMNFVLALTVGLLAFLAVDMWEEAHETAAAAVGALDAPVLIPLVALLTMGLLIVIGQALRRRTNNQEQSPLALAYQIALGIGLHNLGEGLAIGAAFALGEAALGVFLVVGFTLHNITEGVGIAAPILRERPRLVHFLWLALLGGGPAIVGTWIGGFAFSNLLAAVFLAVGAGAILQVIYEVTRLLLKDSGRSKSPALSAPNLGGPLTR